MKDWLDNDRWAEYDSRKERERRNLYLLLTIVTTLFLLLVFILNAHADVSTKKAIIHHTASHDVSARVIDQWHKERGWDGIGYHFVIRKNGTIEEGRDLSKTGAHAKGRNRFVGIALTGFDTFTVAQIEALKELLKNLGVQEVERHHERCPSRGVPEAFFRERIW